jgi:hypothetical protein
MEVTQNLHGGDDISTHVTSDEDPVCLLMASGTLNNATINPVAHTQTSGTPERFESLVTRSGILSNVLSMINTWMVSREHRPPYALIIRESRLCSGTRWANDFGVLRVFPSLLGFIHCVIALVVGAGESRD